MGLFEACLAERSWQRRHPVRRRRGRWLGSLIFILPIRQEIFPRSPSKHLLVRLDQYFRWTQIELASCFQVARSRLRAPPHRGRNAIRHRGLRYPQGSGIPPVNVTPVIRQGISHACEKHGIAISSQIAIRRAFQAENVRKGAPVLVFCHLSGDLFPNHREILQTP